MKMRLLHQIQCNVISYRVVRKSSMEIREKHAMNMKKKERNIAL